MTEDESSVELEPAVAADIFGSQITKARQFAYNLAVNGETLGLIGPRELPRLWSRHILNCAVVAPLLNGRVGDVGSGAGLPGIVLAIARPDVEFVLIEPMERRVAWLQFQVEELGLHNVDILNARAEDVVDAQLDQVTARAVSALKTLLPITVPLLRRGGELILMKGEGAQREIDAAQKQIRALHIRNIEVLSLGQQQLGDVTRVVRATVE